MNTAIESLELTGVHLSPWKLIGLTGALMFGGRWVVQFLASRKHRKPVIPRLFWYMSLLGSLMTLSYFVFSHKQDSVGIVQNLFPAFTAAYSRSEEHTSELQSLMRISYAVFCLKKKNKRK